MKRKCPSRASAPDLLSRKCIANLKGLAAMICLQHPRWHRTTEMPARMARIMSRGATREKGDQSMASLRITQHPDISPGQEIPSDIDYFVIVPGGVRPHLRRVQQEIPLDIDCFVIG